MRPYPMLCEGCNDDIKRNMGCGFEEQYKGNARLEYELGSPSLRTCPRYYWLQPEISYYYENLTLWKAGRLSMDQLSAPEVDAYRVCENAQTDWKAEQERQISASR